MNRLLLTLTAALLAAAAFGLTNLTSPTPTRAQTDDVCVTVTAGEHTFFADARDREGEVTFTIVVNTRGRVTEFYEPGGRSIPPSAMRQVFGGEDPYELPDGIAIVECDTLDGDSLMEADDDSSSGGAAVCLTLDAGTHTANVSAGGRSYDLTLHVQAGGRLLSVDLLGANYSPRDALNLLEQFGATLPAHIQIIACAAVTPTADHDDDSMMEDEESAAPEAMQDEEDDEPVPTLYANTGTGGLASDPATLSAVSAILAAAALTTITALLRHRRQAQRP